MWPIPGLVLVGISRRHLANGVLHSVLTSQKTLAQRSGLSEEKITLSNSAGVVDKLHRMAACQRWRSCLSCDVKVGKEDLEKTQCASTNFRPATELKTGAAG